MPTVSIIVPNYNHGRFLRQRIDSILAQTYRDFELILLDDRSTDESCVILKEYASNSRARLLVNDSNSGSPFKQWNKGIRMAQGKYIWIAESDDYAEPIFLERLIPMLEKDLTLAYAYCRSWRVPADGQVDRFGDEHLEKVGRERWAADFCVDGREECEKYFSRVNPVPNASAVVFRKDVYERVGGVDESFRICGDWKLWAAMALTGKISYLSVPLNYFRFHEASVRRETARQAVDVAEGLRVARWVLERVRPSPPLLEMIRVAHAKDWVPAILSTHVRPVLKRAILQDVKAIDPHPVRTAVRPGLLAFQRKVLRHWRELQSVFRSRRYANR